MKKINQLFIALFLMHYYTPCKALSEVFTSMRNLEMQLKNLAKNVKAMEKAIFPTSPKVSEPSPPISDIPKPVKEPPKITPETKEPEVLKPITAEGQRLRKELEAVLTRISVVSMEDENVEKDRIKNLINELQKNGIMYKDLIEKGIFKLTNQTIGVISTSGYYTPGEGIKWIKFLLEESGSVKPDINHVMTADQAKELGNPRYEGNTALSYLLGDSVFEPPTVDLALRGLEVADYLIKNGADLSIKNKEGLTLLQVVRKEAEKKLGRNLKAQQKYLGEEIKDRKRWTDIEWIIKTYSKTTTRIGVLTPSQFFLLIKLELLEKKAQ